MPALSPVRYLGPDILGELVGLVKSQRLYRSQKVIVLLYVARDCAKEPGRSRSMESTDKQH